MASLRALPFALVLVAGCSFETQQFVLPGADVPGTTDVPRDASVADVPVADVPVADVPAADVPAADVPVADVPVADVPVADVPDAPTADAPVADVPGCGAGPACGIGTLCCGGRCIDVQGDGANCGGCGVTCSATQTCCAGACRDTASSATSCGRCDNVCEFMNATPSCRAGQCAIGACATGFGDCDGNASNGCEAELASDAAHCGACGRACTAGANARASCAAGACQIVCEQGYGNCDGSASNGCETSVTAVANCGACGSACAPRANASATCTAGSCAYACNTGFADCDGDPANGCEVGTATSAANCGACGVSCARPNGTGTCAAGACSLVCATGFASCDGNADNGCERPVSTDVANCGACNRACAAGQVCSGSVCTSICAAPTTLCGGACVDYQTDVRNCGRCGSVCPTPANGVAACVAGACAVGSCARGYGDCDRVATNGCEVNLATTAAHCGACGDACSTVNNAPACVASNCRLTCSAGYDNCDGDVDNGCETSVRTVTNCGACGTACAVANGTGTCSTGTCAVGRCAAGYDDCDRNVANGCEATLLSDNANCGACGTACRAGMACSRGVCSSVCALGLTYCSGRCVDLQSDRSNCGACARACNLLQVCTAGACGFPPPSNDLCANATEINLAAGSRIDVSATTLFATHNLDAPCYGVGLADVFFRFTLTRREVVYADTFGATWDTKLFFASSCTAPLTRAAQAGELLCDDNLGSACTQGSPASQVTAILNPGTYYLVLQVQAGSTGSATIHFEHLPTGNGAVNFLSGPAVTVTGTTSGTGSVRSATCGGSGPENAWFWQTCQGSAGGAMTATTCSRASWDTVLHVAHGNGTTACNDSGATCSPQSSLSATVPAGAGLHVLYVDGFSTAAGTYSAYVTRPASQ